MTYTDSVLGRQDHQAVPSGTGLWDPEDGQTGLESARSEEEWPPHPAPRHHAGARGSQESFPVLGEPSRPFSLLNPP